MGENVASITNLCYNIEKVRRDIMNWIELILEINIRIVSEMDGYLIGM